jgi:hypothetical protein
VGIPIRAFACACFFWRTSLDLPEHFKNSSVTGPVFEVNEVRRRSIPNAGGNETFGRGSLYCESLIRGREQYK